MTAGVHVPLRFLRAAAKKGLMILKSRLPTIAQTTTRALQPVYAHIPQNTHRHLHPAIRNKVAGRWYSTAVKNFVRNTAPKAIKGPSIRSAVTSKVTVSSPFASTLRPTLTSGAFPRTAGGYGLGGARNFSHMHAAPAQVMQQVSCAMRAFINSGKGQMESYRRHDGKMGRIGVRAQLAASLALTDAPGAYVDFDLSPTMTSLSPLNTVKYSLEDETFLESLAADFGAMMSSIVAINADIRRLSTLGDLPISLVGSGGHILRVHFRGCDMEFVERLCDEVGVRRGVVHEDERFAFGMLAPGYDGICWQEMMSASPPLSSTYSEDGFLDEHEDEIKSRITGSESFGEDYYFDPAERPVILASPEPPRLRSHTSSSDYSGLQGIHRFLEECDEYRLGLSAWRQ